MAYLRYKIMKCRREHRARTSVATHFGTSYTMGSTISSSDVHLSRGHFRLRNCKFGERRTRMHLTANPIRQHWAFCRSASSATPRDARKTPNAKSKERQIRINITWIFEALWFQFRYYSITMRNKEVLWKQSYFPWTLKGSFPDIALQGIPLKMKDHVQSVSRLALLEQILWVLDTCNKLTRHCSYCLRCILTRKYLKG